MKYDMTALLPLSKASAGQKQPYKGRRHFNKLCEPLRMKKARVSPDAPVGSGFPVRPNQGLNVEQNTFSHSLTVPLLPPSKPFVERNIKGLLGGHVFALRGTQTQ